MKIYAISGFSDPVSSMTHLFSAPVFLVIGIKMLWKYRGIRSRSVSLLLFVLSVVFLLAMSGVFHLLTPNTDGRYVLQMLDHAAIFTLIASTFTPIHLLHFTGFMRWGILLIIWATAITGITLKSVYFEDFPELLSLTIYLCMGWLGAITGHQLYKRLGLKTIAPLIYGAMAYTLGATLEFVRYPIIITGVIGPHELFHVLVLIGISFHWQFIDRMARLHKQNQST